MQKTSDATIDLLNFTIRIKIKALYAMEIMVFLVFYFVVSNAKKHMNETQLLMKIKHIDLKCNVKVSFQI